MQRQDRVVVRMLIGERGCGDEAEAGSGDDGMSQGGGDMARYA